jgi:hypothetical protein
VSQRTGRPSKIQTARPQHACGFCCPLPLLVNLLVVVKASTPKQSSDIVSVTRVYHHHLRHHSPVSVTRVYRHHLRHHFPVSVTRVYRHHLRHHFPVSVTRVYRHHFHHHLKRTPPYQYLQNWIIPNMKDYNT